MSATAIPETVDQAALDSALAAIRAGTQLRTALLAHGVNPKLLEVASRIADGGRAPAGVEVAPELVERVTRFMLAAQQAMAELESELAQKILEIGTMPTKAGPPDWRALSFWLTHSGTRRDWFEHRSQQIDVQQHGAMTEEQRLVQQLPMEDVLELAGPEFRDLL